MKSLGQRLNSVAQRYRRSVVCGVAWKSAAVFRSPHIFRIVSTSAEQGSAAEIGRVSVGRRSRLEAVLLMAREPLSLRKLAQLANLADGTEARTLITQLQACYDGRGCAFQVEQLAGGYQLLTRPKFAQWLRPFLRADQEIRLSPPALETLAVVAYRQPVLRAEIESIRGVACGELLRQLMDRDLLRIVGRSEELGRPLWYGTTKRFLQTFGLRSLEELPLASELRRRGDSKLELGEGATKAHAATSLNPSGILTEGVEAA